MVPPRAPSFKVLLNVSGVGKADPFLAAGRLFPLCFGTESTAEPIASNSLLLGVGFVGQRALTFVRETL
jgi:hypothetical protein